MKNLFLKLLQRILVCSGNQEQFKNQTIESGFQKQVKHYKDSIKTYTELSVNFVFKRILNSVFRFIVYKN